GTGRGVIREALKILKQKGLVEIKKGAQGGAYILEAGISNASESLALFLKQKNVDPSFVIEFRESIDRTITTLAISRGTEDEKQQLIDYADELEKVADNIEPDLTMLVEIDRQLNLLLAKMTKNPIFQWIMETLQLGFNSLDIALYEDPVFRLKTISNWHATAMLISQKEILRVQSHIDLHYHYLRECLKNKKETNSEIEDIIDSN
ncbi:MAG: FCD domain-containing protein, partial [Bacteroidales bacterium]|nr:FCD domain-containing protein [Bacteroidales bacterium]